MTKLTSQRREAAKVLTVRNLCKRYGPITALQNVSLSIRAGEIVGLLGPNGAGKTTTIPMILGVLAPDEGDISIEGHALRSKRSVALGHTHFAAVYAPLPGNLTTY